MPAAARSLSLCPLPLPRCHLAPPSRLPLAPPPRPPPPPRSVVAADPSRCHLRFQPSPSPATSASPPRAASTSSAAAIAPPSLGASASPLALLPSPSAAVSASATAVAVAERRRCRLRLASLLLLLPSTAVGPSSTAAAITERRRCVLRCLRQRPLLCPPPLPEPTSRKVGAAARRGEPYVASSRARPLSPIRSSLNLAFVAGSKPRRRYKSSGAFGCLLVVTSGKKNMR
uniref:Uncharacterized protein n=1 Tax=Oryza meridionalis TaxID=40149 RepID=A0A0E0EPR2_9ORYZ